ncbi:MAG TPA: hypothetical protein VIH90_01570 [Candidatus Saccharimonadales bacterium]
MSSNEAITPEALSPNIEAIEGFRSNASKMIIDFNTEEGVMGGNGIRDTDGTIKGTVTTASLYDALDRLTTVASEDPTVANLIQTVNTAREVNSTPDDEGTPRFEEPRQTPEYALLKLFGAVKENKPMIAFEHREKDPSREEERTRKFGHQILVDGHMVEGLMVPGRNEVVTSSGTLRTRGTPQSDNR